jgi:selenocysteine lyase/cysteine desulfurase
MSTIIDVARARSETPGCAEVIHFNNAGAALMPDCVLAAVKDHLELEARIGGYEAAEDAGEALDAMYGVLARLINAEADEIAFIENATRAWDMAFYALARDFSPGDRILTAEAEYASNVIAYLQVAALADMIDARVKLIAVTHVPTNGGLVNPAAAIGRVARGAGVPYLLDACQSVGQMPIDVEAIGCDMLSATGRKFLRGPRGTGFLYVRRGLLERLEPPLLDMRAAVWTAPGEYRIREDARRFENWESFVAGRLGLAVAADYALQWGVEAIYGRIQALADDLRARLAVLPGVTLHDLGAERCGIVTFSVAGTEARKIVRRMRGHSINVNVSEPLGTRFDAEKRGLPNMVRASVHYYNSEAEIERFLEVMGPLAGG